MKFTLEQLKDIRAQINDHSLVRSHIFWSAWPEKDELKPSFNIYLEDILDHLIALEERISSINKNLMRM